jgi:colicin import membrane protein
VQKEWQYPPTAKKGMQCRMIIRLLPSGEVSSVQITQSSGNIAFDDAAERAVLRASPLPVSISKAGKLFDRFREMDFLFNPENL